MTFKGSVFVEDLKGQNLNCHNREVKRSWIKSPWIISVYNYFFRFWFLASITKLSLSIVKEFNLHYTFYSLCIQGFNKIWLDQPIDWSEESVVAMYNNWIEHVKKTVPSGKTTMTISSMTPGPRLEDRLREREKSMKEKAVTSSRLLWSTIS